MVIRARDDRYFFRIIEEGEGKPPVALQPVDGTSQPQEPAFAFCSTADAKSKVVMAGAGKIWAATVEGGISSAWAQVGEATQPQFLHAFSPRGRTCWVEWFEKDIGLRRAPLP